LQAAILDGLAQGMRRRKTMLTITAVDEDILVKTFFASASTELRRASLQLLKVNGLSNKSLLDKSLARAVSIAADKKQPEEKRADAVNFISLGDPALHMTLLKKLLVPQEKPEVQLAALQTLSKIPSTTIAEYLIQQWPVLTSEIRQSAIGVLMSSPQRSALLIDALEKGKILTSSVSFPRSVSLMQAKDPDLRNRARKLFTKSEEQAKIINKQYQSALQITGDPVKGKQVFGQNCISCHQVRGQLGLAFGPDLGTIHNWKKEDIMANILDPSLSISAGFELWEVELNDGESVQGIMASETPTAITLRNFGKADRTINRQEIKSLRSLNISAMTSGFEKSINQEQMADLLAFIRQN
jgi:putative heme-binding domain-containing protein